MALVVGNDAYDSAALRNALNDARRVAEVLEELNFSVDLVENASHAEFSSRLARFVASLQADDVALFYFAGHGVQIDGENYLVPVDFEGRSSMAARLRMIPTSVVQNELRASRVAMLVLDACRNNPFSGTRSTGQGLAPIEARGTLVAFSTGAGQTASDNPNGDNSLFTQEFVEALREPGLTVTELFRRVRTRVYDASGGTQWPAVYDDLLGDVVLRPEGQAAGGPNPAPSPKRGTELARREELALWESIQTSTIPAVFEDYLRRYPTGRFAVAAQARLDHIRDLLAQPDDQRQTQSPSDTQRESQARLDTQRESQARLDAQRQTDAELSLRAEVARWKASQATHDPAALEAYLTEYPEGEFAADARAQLEVRRWEVMQPDPTASDLAAYVQQYPNGRFTATASELLASLRADAARWNAIELSSDPAEFVAYLADFPDGGFVDDARAALEELRWQAIQSSPTSAAIEAYLRDYPNGQFTGAARDILTVRRAEMERWETIENRAGPAAYEAYLEDYPEGQFAEEARAKLEVPRWVALSGSTTPAPFEEYLREYPDGRFVMAAWARLAAFQTEATLWDTIRDSSDRGVFEAYLADYPNGQFVQDARLKLAAWPVPTTNTAIETDGAGPAAEPSPIQALLATGVTALRRGDIEAARDAYAAILEIDPQHPSASDGQRLADIRVALRGAAGGQEFTEELVSIGNAALERGDFTVALDAFEAVLAIDANHAIAAIGRQVAADRLTGGDR